MKTKLFKIGMVLSVFALVLGCEVEKEFTGESTLMASSPSLSVSADFADSQTLVEMDATYSFTATLSEAQIANVAVYLTQVGGDATKGEDFDFPDQIVIPAGSTSASGVITLLSDEAVEGTESASIKIGTGREANVTGVTSKTVNFNIMNMTGGDLAVGMSWATASATTDNSGNEISATDLADLILEIQDATGTAVHTADGGSFETSAILADDPDGEYFLVASFYAAEDITRDLNLTSTFSQAGVMSATSFDFAAALNTAFVCDNNFYTLNKIVKSGETYTIESVGEKSAYPQNIAGTYTVVSNGESTDSGPVNNPLVAFTSTVTITDNGDGTYTSSDGWAGVYIDWYNIYGNTEPEPQVLAVDICTGELSASWTDIFGGGQTLTGTINLDGTLTIRVDNVYGDFVDAIYAP